MEKEIQDRALEAALEQAEIFKNEGNEFFKNRNYNEAIRLYSQAIELNPDNEIYYSNRSAAYLAEGSSRGKALKDGEKCIELKPNWYKGYLRKGAAEHALNRYDAAIHTYFRGLEFNPNNKSIEDAIQTVRESSHLYSEKLKKEAKERENYEENSLKNNQENNNVSEDQLLHSFLSEVKEIEDNKNCIKKTKEEIEKRKELNFGTSKDQVNRLLQPHYKWINLNPFQVLLLDIVATEEDIKQHYRKLATLVHPDKCQIPKAREAFEELVKANMLLKDELKRKNTIKIIENARKKVDKERKNLLKKGMKESQLGDIIKAKEKSVMKAFAEIENRRINTAKREAAQRKRESEQQNEEQKKMMDDFKREKEWSNEERRDKRMESWRGFEETGKRQKVVAAGWKGEKREIKAYGKTEKDSYKKNWK